MAVEVTGDAAVAADVVADETGDAAGAELVLAEPGPVPELPVPERPVPELPVPELPVPVLEEPEPVPVPAPAELEPELAEPAAPVLEPAAPVLEPVPVEPVLAAGEPEDEVAVEVTDVADGTVGDDGEDVEVAACACREKISNMRKIPAATIAPCIARRAM